MGLQLSWSHAEVFEEDNAKRKMREKNYNCARISSLSTHARYRQIKLFYFIITIIID